MRKMKQQVMTAPGRIEFREVPIPDLKKNEILAKIMRIGICGSDVHVYHGKHPNTSYPVTQGHEASAKIIKTGNNVRKFKPGEKITIQPQIVCGKCYQCLQGNYHICSNLKVMGFQAPGVASEYFVCDVKKALKLPKNMTYDEGAMIEPTAVACHALSKINDIKEKNVLVLGAGPIGNLVAQTAKGLGSGLVMITDLNEFRLIIAKNVGIDYTINPMKQDLAEEITKVFGKNKMDLIVECVGINDTINTAIKNARKGTDIIIVGVFGEKAKIDLGAVQDRELRLLGTLMYQTKDYIKAIELINKGLIKLKPLMTTHFAFKDYSKAYEYIDKNKDKIMKVFIDVNEDLEP